MTFGTVLAVKKLSAAASRVETNLYSLTYLRVQYLQITFLYKLSKQTSKQIMENGSVQGLSLVTNPVPHTTVSENMTLQPTVGNY
jgi:hypothetical protein